MKEPVSTVTAQEKAEATVVMSASQYLALVNAVKYIRHLDGCDGYYAWSDTCDHFRTSEGAQVKAAECGCGAFQVALQIEKVLHGGRAIPRQHHEELAQYLKPADETPEGAPT